MSAQIRKKKNLLERETKLNNLAQIFHRKLETLLIYIRVPKKKQEKLFFNDFFNVEEVSAYINTVVDDEQCVDGMHDNHLDHAGGKPCSGESSLNLNADNEIKSNKDIFIKNLLIFLNNLIVLYFSKSNLIDVCINRRSFNKCGFYACDNVFLNAPNKGKYKIDAKSKNIYLREYYDLFCSASCMNYNLHLLKEIAKNAKNANNAKGGPGGAGGDKTNLKTKCQLIYIMFLTFFPIFKFHDINVLLNNLELVYIQNHKIFFKSGKGEVVQMDGKDKGDAHHTHEKNNKKNNAVNGEDKVCTIRTVKDQVSQKNHQLKKTLFPIIVEKQDGCEDNEEEITDESPQDISSNDKVIPNHVVRSDHPQGETSNERDGNKMLILPLVESLRDYTQVKTKEDHPTKEEGDNYTKKEQGKNNKCKNVRFNEDVQTYEYFKDERVDVYSVAKTSMEVNHEGAAQGEDSPPSEDIITYNASQSGDASKSDEDDHGGKVDSGEPTQRGETTMREEPAEETNGQSVTLQGASDEEVKEEAARETEPPDGEMAKVYEQVRQSIFTNHKHFFEDILTNNLFDSNKVIGFDYEGGEQEDKEKQAEQVEEEKQVEQTEEKQVEQEKTEKDLRTCAAQRMSEINLKHDRERKGRRIVLLSSPGGGGATRGIPQANEGGGAPEEDEAESVGAMSDVVGREKEDATSLDEEKEDATSLDEEKEDATSLDEEKEDATSRDEEKEDAASPDEENEDAASRDEQKEDAASPDEEDNEKLQNLLMEKKKKISKQYDETFNRCMPPFLFSGTDGDSGGEECPEDLLNDKDESSDDEEQVQQVKGQNKYTYSTDKCSAYEDMSLYVVLWDILTGIISQYTFYFFQGSEFIIPKCLTEEERDRKNEFLRNVSQHMPRTIHPIAPTILNVCQTFSFGKPLLPFKKIIYESIIYVIAAALARHKVELIPSGEMENVRKAEEFLILENGMDEEQLEELAMLFCEHFCH
ncbi:hypothetical protein AK88_05078 [Plasmodium fragile]|uniref:RNA polymerase II subunit B1 CTD phosphatase RPAP2 homolog n=1 Tax=Plasmodium fragile TaxID=5857 RepID=A0A0D9QHV7_PLAFR|nr:uncharacterized protein AK88_05078 [Plasmodium fragile]KJP85296.1 hypothetical protein AK88_05078 [Plasmodium fragile]